MTRNTQPKYPVEQKEFCWEAVLALHPDKLAKISIQTPPSPLTPPPSPPPHMIFSLSLILHSHPLFLIPLLSFPPPRPSAVHLLPTFGS